MWQQDYLHKLALSSGTRQAWANYSEARNCTQVNSRAKVSNQLVRNQGIAPSKGGSRAKELVRNKHHYSTDTDIADCFNQHCIHLHKPLRRSNMARSVDNTTQFEIPPITECFVLETIVAMDTNKAVWWLRH